MIDASQDDNGTYERLRAKANHINSARHALRQNDCESASASAHKALNLLSPNIPSPQEQAEYAQLLHILADACAASGDLHTAHDTFEKLLVDTSNLLEPGTGTNIRLSAIHSSIADIKRLLLELAPDTLDAETRKSILAEIYAHTSTAVNLLSEQPYTKYTAGARFFAYRVAMLASVMDRDVSHGGFCLMQMEVLASEPDSLVDGYWDAAISKASQHIRPDEPPIVATVPHITPPTSAYLH